MRTSQLMRTCLGGHVRGPKNEGSGNHPYRLSQSGLRRRGAYLPFWATLNRSPQTELPQRTPSNLPFGTCPLCVAPFGQSPKCEVDACTRLHAASFILHQATRHKQPQASCILHPASSKQGRGWCQMDPNGPEMSQMVPKWAQTSLVHRCT